MPLGRAAPGGKALSSRWSTVSREAIATIDRLSADLRSAQASDPELAASSLYLGGVSAILNDVRDNTNRDLQVMALVVITGLFIVLLFGLIDFGRLIYINNAVSQAAREGSRWGSVQRRSETAASRDTIRDTTLGSMAAVPAPSVTVTCERDGAAVPTCRTNDILVVRVDSTVGMLTPVLGQVFGPVTVSGTAKVTVNQ